MRNKQWRFVRPLRRIVQWGVVALFCVLPWLSMHEWTHIYGSLFALDVYGIPFSDPASVLWPLTDGEAPVRLWQGLGLTLLLALLAGRVFCGWICPYGLLSEYALAAHQKARAFLNAHAPASTAPRAVAAHLADAGGEGLQAHSQSDSSIQDANTNPDNALPAFWTRLIVLGLGLAASMLFASPLLPWLSMPGTLSLLPVQGWYGAEHALSAIAIALLLPAGVLGLEALTGLRLWCKWMCPQAVLLSVAAKLGRPFLHVRWDEQVCKCPTNYRPCASACSMGLRSRQQGGPSRGECVQCAACVAACHCKGLGALRVGLPKPKKTLHEV